MCLPALVHFVYYCMESAHFICVDSSVSFSLEWIWYVIWTIPGLSFCSCTLLLNIFPYSLSVGCLCFWLISISSMQFCGTLPPVGHLFRLNFYVKSMFDECWVFNLLFDWNAIPHEILTFWNHLVTFQFLTCY